MGTKRNEMCKDMLRNRKSKEVHIYWENYVNQPELINTGNEPEIIEVDVEVNEELYDDDYESAKDEAYKHSPAGVEDES